VTGWVLFDKRSWQRSAARAQRKAAVAVRSQQGRPNRAAQVTFHPFEAKAGPCCDAWERLRHEAGGEYANLDQHFGRERIEHFLDGRKVSNAMPCERDRALDTRCSYGSNRHGARMTLCSTDGDFARIPDLRWLNPIA
jgi:hypothetical protein